MALDITPDLLTALFTGAIAIITFLANKNLSKISSYANNQNDRRIIERIFHHYEESHLKFERDASCDDLKKMYPLLKARDLAHLYDLNNIYLHLDKIYKEFSKGYVIHNKIWFENGGYRNNYTTEEMNKYHESIKLLYDYFADTNCFRNRLKICL